MEKITEEQFNEILKRYATTGRKNRLIRYDIPLKGKKAHIEVERQFFNPYDQWIRVDGAIEMPIADFLKLIKKKVD